MSNQHVLKIHPAPLADLMSGAKTAEVRRNDRDFQVGDTVRLIEVNPETDNDIGNESYVRTISHVQTGYGLPDGMCVLSYADTAPREALAQLAQAIKLLGWSKYQLMLWEDYQVENGFEVEDHYMTGKVREEVEAFLAGHGQAEQRKAREPVLARPEHGASLDEAMALTMDRYSGALNQLAVIEQQEALGVQASDFQREDRYIVIKRKDFYRLPMEMRLQFSMALRELAPRLPKREYLVVESDWPEYEPTWAAIQARVEGCAAVPDEEDLFFEQAKAELRRARAKFPGDRIMTLALAEEFGELCKAVLDESPEAVRKEAVQVACMAARVVLDGDGSVVDWRRERGLDPLLATVRGAER